MYKIILSFILLFSIIIGLTSCYKECQTCSNVIGSGISEEFCEEDFLNKTEYLKVIRALEKDGAKCK